MDTNPILEAYRANSYPEMTMDDLRQEFAKGYRRQSRLILDNVGIYVKMDELPSGPMRIQCTRAIYGTTRLTRLWCRHLRPRLLPEHQAVLEYALRQVNEQIQAEFLDAVLEQGRELGYVEEGKL